MTLVKNKLWYIIGSAAVLCIAVLVFSFFRSGARQFELQFPLIGSEKIVTEVRSVHTYDTQPSVVFLVDELLLGPSTPRARPLFSRGTKVVFCFVRDKTLYVNLSKEALFEQSDAAKVLDGIALFKSNVLRNCKSVKEIALFIDGRAVGEEAENLPDSSALVE